MVKIRLFIAPAAAALVLVGAPHSANAQLMQPSIAANVPVRSDVRDLGLASRSQVVSLAITLHYRHEAELSRLVDAQGDPSSPYFGRFLNNDQFNAYFAPSQADYARVAQTLERAGFRVTGTYDNRTLLNVEGPAQTADAYFKTEIHEVFQNGYGLRYANARPAILPGELQNDVVAISGFDNLNKAQYDWVRGRRLAVQPDNVGGMLHGPDGGFGPVALATGFDFPVQHGFDGTGHAVANVAGTVKDSDIKSFLTFFGETRTGKTHRTLIQGTGAWSPSDPAVVEATLDVETMASLAPGADIYLYILEDPIDAPGESAYNKIVSDNKVDVVNSSFGVCETDDQPYAKAANHIATQGEAKGITFSASAGDGGSQECSSTTGQSTPAVEPRFVSVGGTSLFVNSHAKYMSEQTWSGTGGGVSAVLTIPKYQIGVPGLASTTHRNVPDIAFPADPSTGFSFFFGGAFQGPIGGTSWSSPTYCALQVTINEKDGKRFGYVNPSIYAAFKAHGYTVFHDIKIGSNGGFSAHTGYDNTTGIGSIKGFSFAGVE
jgi:subtilase family serine protease